VEHRISSRIPLHWELWQRRHRFIKPLPPKKRYGFRLFGSGLFVTSLPSAAIAIHSQPPPGHSRPTPTSTSGIVLVVNGSTNFARFYGSVRVLQSVSVYRFPFKPITTSPKPVRSLLNSDFVQWWDWRSSVGPSTTATRDSFLSELASGQKQVGKSQSIL